MKFELDLVRDKVATLFETGEPPTMADQRKALRRMTDDCIEQGLMINSLEALPKHISQVMLTVAASLQVQELEPDVEHFVYAAVALIEDSRKAMDLGMLPDNAPQTTVGAVMMEITMRGICHALGLDYEAALRKEAAT